MAAEVMSKFKFMFAFLYKYNNSSVIFSIIIITICNNENKQPVYICTNEVHKSIPLHSEAR